MNRCIYCDRLVLRWHRRGHYVGTAKTYHWHAACRAARPV